MAITTGTGKDNAQKAQEAIKEANKHVTLKATDGHPLVKEGAMKEGQVFQIHVNHKEKCVGNNWAIETTEEVGTVKPGKDTKVGNKATAAKQSPIGQGAEEEKA